MTLGYKIKSIREFWTSAHEIPILVNAISNGWRLDLPNRHISIVREPKFMPEAKILTGPHQGHTHYECGMCNQWFETERELKEHNIKAHPEKIPAM